jgi:hypothetical protein
MILTVHNLAENYKCLPSEVMSRATTFDLYVLDVHTKWVKYQHEQEKAKQKGGPAQANLPRAPKLSEKKMLDMIKQARSVK